MILTREPAVDAEEKEVKVTNKFQDLDVMTKRVLERIAAEPSYRIVLYKILEYCESARFSSDVEQTMFSFPEMKGAIHSPLLLLSWLQEAGGIEQLLVENSKAMWCTTPAGRNALKKESNDNRLGRLIVQEPIYQEIYLQILQACLSPKSRMEIETMLNGNPILKEAEVYPTFFIENLEETGGLEWDKEWKTTAAGEDLLNRQAKCQT